MAKIVDPDSIAQGTDVVLNTSTKTIQLLITGAISDDSPGRDSGITGKCLYSFLKEEWGTDTALNKFRFPIKMIYEASFQLINGWSFEDQQTIDVLRDAGFQDIINNDEYSCMITLGNMDNSSVDQAYFDQIAGASDNTTVSNFDKTGEVNENVLVYDGTNDYRDYIKVFLREEQKLFAEYALLTEQGLAALKYEAYRLPLSNGADLKAIDDDTVVGTTDAGSLTGVKYSELSIDYIVGNGFVTATATSYSIDDVVQDTAGRWARCTTAGTMDASGVADYTSNGGTAVWEAYPGERQIGADYYAFNRIVECEDASTNKARTTEIHSWLQYQLRQNVDINADTNGDGYGTVYGKIAPVFTEFVGDQMWGEPGVYFDNLNPNDNNSVTYQDITVDGGGLDSEGLPATSTPRNNPFYASFDLVFSDNLVSETNGDTLFRVYFTNDDAGDNTGRDFDTSTAIVVQDKDSTEITGQISTAINTFQYDYTNNIQRGAASADSDAPITVVFQGLNDSEWNYAQFTVQKSTGQSFACNTADELNYSNP